MKNKVKDAEKGSEKEKVHLQQSISTIKKQLEELEEKQKKFGDRSAKTREEMNRMMKNKAVGVINKIANTDETLRKLYFSTPVSEFVELPASALLPKLDSPIGPSQQSTSRSHPAELGT